MVTLEQLITLIRAQKAAGFFSFLKLQEHIDAATAQLTGLPPIDRGVSEWGAVLFKAIPLLWWQLLFLSLWGVLLLRVATWWRKKLFLPLFSLIFSLLLIAPCLWLRYRMSTAVTAVVEKETDLYSGPSQSFVQMGVLRIGEQVVVEAEYSPRPELVFAKVSASKKRAWIDKSSLGIV